MNRNYELTKIKKLIYIVVELRQLAKFTHYDDDYVMDALSNLNNEMIELKRDYALKNLQNKVK